MHVATYKINQPLIYRDLSLITAVFFGGMKCREGRLAKEKVVSLADGLQMQSVKGEAELEKQLNDSLGHKTEILNGTCYTI